MKWRLENGKTNICGIMITRRRRDWQENNGSRAECLRHEHGDRTMFGRRTRHMTAHMDGGGIYTGNSSRVFQKGPFLSPFRPGGGRTHGGRGHEQPQAFEMIRSEWGRYKRFLLQAKIKKTLTPTASPSPAVFGLIFELIPAQGSRPRDRLAPST